MIYYHIIPIARIPLGKSQYFTYSINDPIPEGSLVEINFANRKLKGIVLGKTKKPFFPTKSISRIIAENFLSSEQLILAQKISDYYFTPLGVVLKFFIPHVIKNITPSPVGNAYMRSLQKRPILTPEQKAAVKTILDSKTTTNQVLLFGPASAGKTEVLMNTIEHMLKKKKQSLVLIPEIFLSYQEIERYMKRFGDKIVLIHSGLKSSEFSTHRKNIAKGKIKIIISTRVGLFLPFKNLGLIAIDEEQDPSYKQWDQNPKYHSHVVCDFLSEIHGCKIIYSSATPLAETFDKATKGKLFLVKIPALKTNKIDVHVPSIEIIDLKKYYFQKKAPMTISKELENALAENLSQKKLSLILVPRRGKSKCVVCMDCKKSLVCPNCETNLIHLADSYRCLHCSFQMTSMSRCPSCKSIRLKDIGFGTEKAAMEIKTLFPKAKMEIADQSHFQKEQTRKELYQKIQDCEIDILVGSQTIVKGFDIPNVGLVSVLNADNWGGKNDFHFDERWLGNLFQISGRLNRPGSDQKGVAVIQTFTPQNSLYETLKNWDWQSFITKELSTRKGLNYPPSRFLVKLTLKDGKKEKVEKTCKTVYNEILKAGLKDIVVFEPYFGFLKKIRNQWQKNILLKTIRLEDPALKKILTKLSKDWSIDINPENIF